MWKQTCLEKGLCTETSAIKFVVLFLANFIQTIYPQSISIFNLWKFELEVVRCYAIHWLFPYFSCCPSFIQCAALLLDQDEDHNDWIQVISISISIFKSRTSSSRHKSLKLCYNGFKPPGGSRAGIIGVLLPCQEMRCHTCWCPTPGQWSCWPGWGGSVGYWRRDEC